MVFTLGQELGTLWPVGPPSVSVSKVILEHSCTHLFIYCLWLLLNYYNGLVKHCRRDQMIHKAKIVDSPALCEQVC